jgi:hypothetical protein
VKIPAKDDNLPPSDSVPAFPLKGSTDIADDVKIKGPHHKRIQQLAEKSMKPRNSCTKK